MPIETGGHILRARRTAATTRVAVGVVGVALIASQPRLLPHPALGVLGFATIALTAGVQLAAPRLSWLSVEESLAGSAGVLLVGFGGQWVNVLSLLWLVAIASGVLARGGRVHWIGRTIVLGALVLPIARAGYLHGDYAAMCVATIALLLTAGRLTSELNLLLRQARLQADNAETLLLAGDIASRVAERSGRAGADGGGVAPEPASRVVFEDADLSVAEGALAQLLLGEGLSMVVQPIVDIRTGAAHAYEALARFSRPGIDGSPLHWFALAEQLGQRSDLERACLRLALDLFAQRPAGTSLSLNLSAPVLLEARTMDLLERAGGRGPSDLDGLIVEITEETLVHSDTQLQAAIEPLRARGASLAVDDMGAGYSGLRQITTVRPVYLKLDRSLVTDIDSDSERAALVGALAGYSKQVGSLLVAEGVETAAELQAVRELGVPLVQGFYLGRPGAPWPEVSVAKNVQAPEAYTRVQRETHALAL
ncbi:MAG TPA: EAL domain-containing protein [Solirubrobacteraceae bacterium]|nr:EAL domain-containing protein [Solirubrobacteraceae bacterium]